MKYPVEKYGIRFYNYYYYDVTKPIVIEARSKQEARAVLKDLTNSILPELYKGRKIIGESVTMPLRGVSEKITNGIKYIWVGEDKAAGGWLNEPTYLRKLEESNRG